MKRFIVHSDINHCYAQIEEMKYPELRNISMAVGGSEEDRHGIILAKNDIAKTYGIKTGESLREAYKKCPELLIINPNYEEYIYYTQQVKSIYKEYTDKVESYGLDEAWFDLTNSQTLFGNPLSIAKSIQDRVYDELGLTVSMGISFNKIFAKLGSDLDKHMGFTIIDEKNYKEVVWSLPIEDLFYVGKATRRKLQEHSICTIGELANSNVNKLQKILGINGVMLWNFANGFDITQVAKINNFRDIKSIGNSITTIQDICSYEEIKMVYYMLCESVASRLKDIDLKGKVVKISLRDKEFKSFSRQMTNINYIDTCNEIMECVYQLIKKNIKYDNDGYFEIPFRSIGLSISKILTSSNEQISLFDNYEEIDRNRMIDLTMDKIRDKYGFDKIQRCLLLKNQKLAGMDIKNTNIIYPESWF